MTTAPPEWPQAWLRSRFGYAARDIALFEAALTHRSASGSNNERLEFLGDAVIDLVAAAELYTRFPDASEGDLSRLRTRLVSEEPLARIAQSLALGEELRLGSGELKTGGHRRQSILADAFEAVCGALFLDAGFEFAHEAVRAFYAPLIDELPDAESLKDPKTRLQEYLQGIGLPLPDYRLDGVEGEAHEQTFRVSCEIPKLAQAATGTGSSRRRAEQEAAERILGRIVGES